ncbi:MAG TPA: DUF2203 domain-containing protein [Clostridia bacterium]|nr:DUF2203 domain-containing protein [Clostridia bacterium]
MPERTFTYNEALSLLPILESLLRTSIESKQTIEEIDAEFTQVNERILMAGGMLLDVERYARRKAERHKAIRRAKDALAEIHAMGVQVKDLDIGLLDFPCVVGEEVVLLCWKMGETGITHWHGTDEGFSARKPIDERISRAGGGRTN